MDDQVARRADAAGLDDRVAANVENVPVEERFARNDFRARDGSLP
ncbi:MAG: hypothetical protein WBD73_15475 [Candidatus Acidiferrales bacterium]